MEKRKTYHAQADREAIRVEVSIGALVRHGETSCHGHATWYEKEDCWCHCCECRSFENAAVEVSQETDSKRANGTDDVRTVKNECLGNAIDDPSDTSDKDGDGHLARTKRLQEIETGKCGEDWDKEEVEPGRQWLLVPRPLWFALASD